MAPDKSFAQLLHDAMATMDRGMREAPMNGAPEHDFVTMMIPHHQGAIDMAKALLLTTKDPELRNLAQGIITEQQNEIRLMRAWLDHHAERLAEQEVAHENAGLVAPQHARGQLAAAQFAFVDHVVMQQGRGVHELDGGS